METPVNMFDENLSIFEQQERMKLENPKLISRPDLPKTCIKRIMAHEACVNVKASSQGACAMTSVITEMLCMRLTRIAWSSTNKVTLQPSHFIQAVRSMPDMDFLTDVIEDFVAANPDHL